MKYLDKNLNRKQEQIKDYQNMNGTLIKVFERLSAEKKKYVSIFPHRNVSCLNNIYSICDTNRRYSSTKTPKEVSSKYIKELKEYNELRDAGLRLAQIIADEKQCKIKDVFEEIGYSMKD
ncbi:hypothetical protein SKDZ_08G1270 [Saccharomyces kudriavzevii ZP591]|uniref:SAE3-like protein n=2 Tax=Saccharomyces TaxID=4930 RepID=A0AA35JKJ5_SACK1|nr:uncharacterized protein SKDI_08G1270 [Saccharomyces kudriavzevii IFO 1802]EHN02094.1 Sae3p [Saccharomyces cerevisiae x Saccharomyces kudriavzevii VIN7]CAI4063720.1 hypothetical protein SKDZ_08G1270 [Saccharomyces kudriavzevii ZP591]CAI4063722.1 hypothetical protein SKDI_08G1270 [Saccharomyces kudriavzevii IFO 1802]